MEEGRVPTASHWRLGDLLGHEGDRAARDLEATVQVFVRWSRARYSSVRGREEDLAQDVLRAAIREARKIAAHQAEEPSNLDAWLNRVTLNAVRKAWRNDRIGRATDDQPDYAEQPDPRPLPSADQLAIRQAFPHMDPICRTLLMRRIVMEESRDVLAAWLNLSTNAVGVRIHRCLKKLLELVEGGNVPGPGYSGAHG